MIIVRRTDWNSLHNRRGNIYPPPVYQLVAAPHPLQIHIHPLQYINWLLSYILCISNPSILTGFCYTSTTNTCSSPNISTGFCSTPISSTTNTYSPPSINWFLYYILYKYISTNSISIVFCSTFTTNTQSPPVYQLVATPHPLQIHIHHQYINWFLFYIHYKYIFTPSISTGCCLTSTTNTYSPPSISTGFVLHSLQIHIHPPPLQLSISNSCPISSTNASSLKWFVVIK